MLTSSDPTEALSPISSAALLDGAQTVAVGLPSEAVGLVSNARLDCVRVALEACGCDALLVRDTSNIRWLTAFDGVFDDERAHELVVAKGIASLHTDSRYSNALRTLAEAAGNVTVDEERVSHAKFASNCLGGIASKGKSSAKVGFEDDITYAEYLSLSKEFSKGKLVPTTDLVKGLRAVKDAIEIARLKAAQAITDAAFRHIVDFMRPGMTEREVQIELEDYMLRHGAEELAFRSIVACGANGADPHAVPGDARLEAGQCVVMDFGAKAAGYCSDMTRMVFLGQPEERIADAYRVLREANEQVEAMLKPGVTGLEAHTLAEKVLADGGYECKMGHGLGHGVGLDIHEEPCLNLRNDKTLVAGNVVTVEPGIYFAGDFGMRLEDCGVVTDEGYLVFSQLGHDMVIV
ncbi:MAG: aminopeptidase P family protein [Eggerthellaceae bacterium]|nr:aminopeptidase P family protein [Eggerthellaceae bacterium]